VAEVVDESKREVQCDWRCAERCVLFQFSLFSAEMNIATSCSICLGGLTSLLIIIIIIIIIIIMIV
jgi:hypothetical protein